MEKLIQLGTSATTTASEAVTAKFEIREEWFRFGIKPSILLEGLTGAETVTLWVLDGASAQQVFDENGNAAQLDAANSKTTITFNTPGLFGVTHSALAAERDLKALY